MRIIGLAVGIALALTPLPTSAQIPLAQAVAGKARTPDNVKLDPLRKPADVLQFLGLAPGMHALDLFGGNRYWSEIMAPVVGPQGSVVAWQPTQFINDKRKAEFFDFAQGQGNVALLASPFGDPRIGTNAYDFAIMNMDYHDVYWQNPKLKITPMDPDQWLRILYAAMKPGAVVGIIDHIAAPNSDTRATVEKYHRIDPAVVKADFERAGFRLEGSSDLLRNPADAHDLNVFDPKIKGHTDRFIFKFRKPAA